MFSRICEHAERCKVKIALENCPMMDRFGMKGENIAFSPEIWRLLFELVPSENLGLELDPSHCVWQRIDYVKATKDFGPRIFHVHAKDMEIVHDRLSDSGIYGVALSRFAGTWAAVKCVKDNIESTGVIEALPERLKIRTLSVTRSISRILSR